MQHSLESLCGRAGHVHSYSRRGDVHGEHSSCGSEARASRFLIDLVNTAYRRRNAIVSHGGPVLARAGPVAKVITSPDRDGVAARRDLAADARFFPNVKHVRGHLCACNDLL